MSRERFSDSLISLEGCIRTLESINERDERDKQDIEYQIGVLEDIHSRLDEIYDVIRMII